MKKTLVLIFTVFLVLIACIGFSFAFESPDNPPVYLSVLSGDKIQKIECWQNENGECFFFVPSFAESSDIKIHLNTTNEVRISDKKITNGMDCVNFEFNTEYEIMYFSFAEKKTKKLTFLKSKNIPAMFIETESGNMDYIHEKKGNKETGFMTLVSDNGDINYFGELESINGRGNYTWNNCEKKSYSLKLSSSANLLEMGQAHKWILLANADDSSNLRNKLVYDFAKEIGLKHSPDSQWSDLYLNGEYVGLYLLSERNEVHSERVDISGKDSFLVSLEAESKLKSQNYTYVTTKANQSLRVHYPTNATANDLDNIRKKFQSVEDVILSEKSVESINRNKLNELIDLDSWVKKYLIEELFGNGDAGATSQFFYLNADDETMKIFAGPVWDYDRAMGNDIAWQLIYPNSFFANRLQLDSGKSTPWFYSLYQKEEFFDLMLEIYHSKFIPLLNETCSKTINEYTDLISQSSKLNQIRWNILKDTKNETKYICDFLNKRTEFLNDIWINNQEYCTIRLEQDTGVHYAYVLVKKGELLNYLHKFEDTEFSVFKGWYYKETDEPFDITKPITEDIEIYVKWEPSLSNKTDDIIKLIPIVLIAVMFVIFFVIELRRIRNGGGGIWQKKTK